MRHALILALAAELIGAAGLPAASEAVTHSSPAPAPAPGAAERLASLRWMAGQWKGKGWEAYYTTPRGGMILGTSKEFDGQKLVMPEFEKIEVVGEAVVLTPYPFTKPSEGFTLSEPEPGRKTARFVNPANDFPSEIRYRRLGPRKLEVSLKGTQ